MMLIYSLMYLVGAGLIWFALQTIKHPVVGFPSHVSRVWQAVLLVLGGGLIVSTFFI